MFLAKEDSHRLIEYGTADDESFFISMGGFHGSVMRALWNAREGLLFIPINYRQ